MELLQLKYFCDAAETENFSKTAQRFMVPPSAVSQSIKRLEKELGVSLFERNANKVTLNDDGRIFYASASQMFSVLNDAKKKISDKSEEISGEIRLQIFCNRRIVSEAIKIFKKRYGDVTFVLNHGFLTGESFDLIISDYDFSDGELAKKELLVEDIALGVAKNHPLAQKQNIKLSALASENFITMHQNGRQYHLTRELCASAGFSPKISIRCDDPFYIRKYIEMGLGVGFVPMFSWQGQLSGDIVLKKLEGLKRTTYIFWDSSRYMTRAVSEFLKLLGELCRS